MKCWRYFDLSIEKGPWILAVILSISIIGLLGAGFGLPWYNDSVSGYWIVPKASYTGHGFPFVGNRLNNDLPQWTSSVDEYFFNLKISIGSSYSHTCTYSDGNCYIMDINNGMMLIFY